MTPLRSEKNSFNVSESDRLMTGFKYHSICDQNKKNIDIYIYIIIIFSRRKQVKEVESLVVFARKIN